MARLFPLRLPRRSTLIALAILATALAVERLFGFRLGQEAGQDAEMVMAVALVVAAPLIFAPVGRHRRVLMSAAALLMVVTCWAANVSFSTSLDEAYGGSYGYSGERVLVLSIVIGPVLGVAAAMLTFASTYLPMLNGGKFLAPRRGS